MVVHLSTSHATLLSHYQLLQALLSIAAHQLSCMETEGTGQAKRVTFRQGLVETSKKLRRIPPVRGRIKRRIFVKLYKILKLGARRSVICASSAVCTSPAHHSVGV